MCTTGVLPIVLAASREGEGGFEYAASGSINGLAYLIWERTALMGNCGGKLKLRQGYGLGLGDYIRISLVRLARTSRER